MSTWRLTPLPHTSSWRIAQEQRRNSTVYQIDTGRKLGRTTYFSRRQTNNNSETNLHVNNYQYSKLTLPNQNQKFKMTLKRPKYYIDVINCYENHHLYKNEIKSAHVYVKISFHFQSFRLAFQLCIVLIRSGIIYKSNHYPHCNA